MLVRFHDGAIHAGGEAKIVGVDDQSAHRASLAGKSRLTEDGRSGLSSTSSDLCLCRPNLCPSGFLSPADGCPALGTHLTSLSLRA